MSRTGKKPSGVALEASNPYSGEALLRGGVMVTHEAHNLGILVQVQTPQQNTDPITPSTSTVGGVMPSRLPFVDVVRGLAVLLVLVSHMFLFAYGSFALPTRNRLVQFGEAETFFDFINHLVRLGGWIGVSIFFAVSGFCIHYGFLRGSEGYGFLSFITRRVARIFPAFIASVIGVLLLRILIGPWLGISSWQEFLGILTLTFNFVGDIQPEINPAYWTLPIEFHLYLLYPVFLIIRKNLGIVKTIILISAPQVLYYTARLYGAYELGWKFELLGPWESSAFGYWFAWGIGAYVAERLLSGKRAFPNWVLPAAFLLFSLPFFWHPAVVARYSIGAFLCAVLLDRNVRSQVSSVLGHLLMKLGKISYSVYLWHMPLMSLIVRWLLPDIKEMQDLAMVLIVCIFFVVVLPVSWLSYHYIERAGIRWGKKAAARLEHIA